jgi:hypothetical protein
LFEITEMTGALLVSITNRAEKHGDDEVPAVSLGLKITGPNTLLDLLSKDLRPALYHSPRNKTVDGVTELAPTLRTKGFDYVALKVGPFEGWTLRVDHGIDEQDPVTFGGCKVDKFKVVPIEGGSIELSLRIGTSDISAESLGIVGMMIGQEIQFTLEAPKTETKTPADGKPTLAEDWPFPGKGGAQPGVPS